MEISQLRGPVYLLQKNKDRTLEIQNWKQLRSCWGLIDQDDYEDCNDDDDDHAWKQIERPTTPPHKKVKNIC